MNRRLLLAKHPEAEPTDDCFTLDTAEIPTPGEGEALVRNTHLSVDPAQRIWMNPGGAYEMATAVGSVMDGLAVGEVVASNNDLEVGSRVTGLFGWQEYAVVKQAAPVPQDVDGADALGVFGMNGQTAYWGLFDVGRPEPGRTVLVSAAAGATGSIVGQLAKIHGCRVVGLAGSADKRAWLTDELGFDAALDYRAPDLAEQLDAVGEIHVYFDNVGGPLLDLVLPRLAQGGRIVLCGAIAAYNDNVWGGGPAQYRQLIRKRGTMQGFIVFDYAARYPESLGKLRAWRDEGVLKTRTDLVQGLENAPAALRKVLSGGNTGKTVVAL